MMGSGREEGVVFLGLSMARRLGWDGMGWDGYLLVEDFGMLELAMSKAGDVDAQVLDFWVTEQRVIQPTLMKPTTLDL